jgi:PAS domain S-box-containing protein
MPRRWSSSTAVFRGVGFMATTATLWDEADAQVVELAAVGDTLRGMAPAAKGSSPGLQPALARIRTLERKVTAVNDAIAAALSEGLRQTPSLLMAINVAVGVALLMIALTLTHRLVRNRENAENDLRISEERFEYAVLASNDGIWDWSLRREHLFLSARFETLLGFEPGGMHETPASFLRRIHPRDRHAAASALRTHLRSGNRFDLEFRLRMNDGVYRWFRTRGRSVLDVDGKPRRMAGIAHRHHRSQTGRKRRSSRKRNGHRLRSPRSPMR